MADPPTIPSPDRVPITDTHRRGVFDPMTASLMRVPGNGDTFVPQACQKELAIFDGRMRYDLHLAFKRLDKVKADKGYQGTVVVCSVRFLPIAGHVPDRAAIKYLADLRDIETWLAPIAGTRVLVPYRISVPTPIGVGVMQRPSSSPCRNRPRRPPNRSDAHVARAMKANINGRREAGLTIRPLMISAPVCKYVKGACYRILGAKGAMPQHVAVNRSIQLTSQ